MALGPQDFDRLIDEHAGALYRTAYRLTGNQHEAEDLVQETYRSAWKSRKRYVHDLSARAWLVAILRRRAIDSWRRKPSQTVSSLGTVEVPINDRNPVDEGYTDEMQRALSLLPDVLRETLLLVIVAEMTHQEVADLLEVPLGTVLSRVSRARRRLRQFFVAEVRP